MRGYYPTMETKNTYRVQATDLDALTAIVYVEAASEFAAVAKVVETLLTVGVEHGPAEYRDFRLLCPIEVSELSWEVTPA